MRLSLSLFLALLIPEFALAATRTFEVVVEAGSHERKHVPVCARITVGPEFHQLKTALLRDEQGQQAVAQLTDLGLTAMPMTDGTSSSLVFEKELHFILPRLAAGKSARYVATLSTEGPEIKADGYSWQDASGAHSELCFAGRPVLRYMYRRLDPSSREKRELTYKPFHHLFDPAGERLVTKGPGGLYTHHRGLFYGFNRVSYGDRKVDVWHCTGGAFQEHEKLLRADEGPVLGRQRVQIAWHGTPDEVFATEERELTVYHVPGGTMVDFASRLKSNVGPVKLDGDPQHAGFHFRADNEVAERTAKETYYIRPDGIGKPGETRNWDPKTRKGPVDLPWNAMSFVLGGERYTVAYLDSPANPKEARFSERDYGRFGSYFEYELTSAKPLVVRYRIWLQRGVMQPEQVAALDHDFDEPVKVTVK